MADSSTRLAHGTQRIDERERALLAPYALHSSQSAGRKYPEPQHPYRGPFQRDRDRIVHTSAYRRLSFKTQVFTGELGDYHRTRLTHTLEVASVSRTVGRALGLNEDLVEALALVHDLGHPPFGHSGEDVLNRCLRSAGGFSHNLQALRLVELLEVRYHDFPGLNLSREVLEGQGFRVDKTPATGQPLLEVQAVEAADSIAYDTHDADDALELGLLTLPALLENRLWAAAHERVRRRYAALERRRAAAGAAARVDRLASERSAGQCPGPAGRVWHRQPGGGRGAPPVIAASEELAQQKEELEKFLHVRVYRHPNVLAHRTAAQGMLDEMFDCLIARPERMPADAQARWRSTGYSERWEIIWPV